MTAPLFTMKNQLITLLANALQTIQSQSIPNLIIPETITLQRCKDPSHGDLATNIALLLAKPLGKNPRDLAQMIVDAMVNKSLLEKVEIAGPGFINFTLKQGQNNAVINQILQSDQPFGHSQVILPVLCMWAMAEVQRLALL